MAPNKHWMRLSECDRLSDEYEKGVEEFVKFAIEKTGQMEIRCPCLKCKNSNLGPKNMVIDHLKVWGIIPNYTFWYHHGERKGEAENEIEVGDDSISENNDDMQESTNEDEFETLVQDLFSNYGDIHGSPLNNDKVDEQPNVEANKFYRLFENLHMPLYNGSRSSTLSAIVNLLHIKTIGKWNNESFTMLLNFLKNELLPSNSNLPDSYYGAKKVIQDLGLSYDKYDACVNDCMLFRKDDASLDFCKICHASRWKNVSHNGGLRTKEKGKKIAQKTLPYFPLKPRLQRLFMSSKTASDMIWHHDKRVKDGVMRHPADSKGWQHFDELHTSFASDPRNVRLGVITDGFDPFSHSTRPYSMWPVMLVPYNLPPWICMKQSNVIFSMIIPGPHGPGDAIDVYLKPLVEELQELWEVGVETYDAAKKEKFMLRAAIISTTNDFPAYAIMSGWSTKGKLACPCCHKDTHSLRLPNCSKQVYMRHRRFLPIDHPWRRKRDVFGQVEKGFPPKMLSGDGILEQVKDLDGICLSNDPNKRSKVSHTKRGDNWNKKSIFFDLPYWKTILVRHNIDVMHIEKNVCDILLGTILNITGNSKDTIYSRLDMQELSIMPKLHPIQKDDKFELPHAPYTLTIPQQEMLCTFLKEMKVPDGFSSNISRCVNLQTSKISGLKSHDCHILLQRILPLAIRGLFIKEVSEPLIELCMFFKILCAKSLKFEDLEQLKAQIRLTLSKLENWLPPSCYDIMLHLCVHLPDEAIINGPVHFRWMYFGERMLFTLKSYVRNKARPEGSIAEGYIANECMTLCSRYLHNIETKFNRPQRNYDGGEKSCKKLSIFSHPGRPLGASKLCDLDTSEREQAHFYALKNCDEVTPFLQEFLHILENEGIILEGEELDRKFVQWFKTKVENLQGKKNVPHWEELLSLSRGPTQYCHSFTGYVTNGYRFNTLKRDATLRTQNSRVVVAEQIANDSETIDYYGVLTNVIRLEYLGGNYITLFRCNWFDVHDSRRGIKVDKFGFVSINTQRHLKTNEPFVLASQVSQVFYVQDIVNKGNWRVAVKTHAQDVYDVPLEEDEGDQDLAINNDEFEFAYQADESFSVQFDPSTLITMEEDTSWSKNHVEPEIVDVSSLVKKRN